MKTSEELFVVCAQSLPFSISDSFVLQTSFRQFLCSAFPPDQYGIPVQPQTPMYLLLPTSRQLHYNHFNWTTSLTDGRDKLIVVSYDLDYQSARQNMTAEARLPQSLTACYRKMSTVEYRQRPLHHSLI